MYVMIVNDTLSLLNGKSISSHKYQKLTLFDKHVITTHQHVTKDRYILIFLLKLWNTEENTGSLGTCSTNCMWLYILLQTHGFVAL